MKKTIMMSIAAMAAVSSSYAAEDLESFFSEGKASGQIRMFYVDRAYQGGKTTHRDSLALGGHLKYETAKYNGFDLGVSFYTTNQINIQQHTADDPSLLGANFEDYSILGEAYIGYDFSELGSQSSLKLGHQRYDTPMMGSDDARMIPNTFNAYKYVNNDVENISFQVAHVDRVAYGTFGNIYNGATGDALAATSGYPMQRLVAVGEYRNLGEATVGKNTVGVTNAMVSFKSANFKATLSDDYAWDLYNTLYADATVNWNCLFNDEVKPFFGLQGIKQNSVGDKLMNNTAVGGDGKIDSLYWAAKFGAGYHGFNAYIAYSETTANDAGDEFYANAIVSQFGGMPAFTQGMVTRHQFLAGTKASKVAASYSFKEQGVNLSTAAYYTEFDVDANSGYGGERTATEPGFDVQYYPEAVKNLQLRFRGNFPRKFAGTSTTPTGWDEYRLIANYNF